MPRRTRNRIRNPHIVRTHGKAYDITTLDENGLRWLRSILEADIDTIDSDLRERAETADKAWIKRATDARSIKIGQIRLINQFIKRRRQAAARMFERVFVTTAKDVLGEEQFKALVMDTNDRIKYMVDGNGHPPCIPDPDYIKALASVLSAATSHHHTLEQQADNPDKITEANNLLQDIELLSAVLRHSTDLFGSQTAGLDSK